MYLVWIMEQICFWIMSLHVSQMIFQPTELCSMLFLLFAFGLLEGFPEATYCVFWVFGFLFALWFSSCVPSLLLPPHLPCIGLVCPPLISGSSSANHRLSCAPVPLEPFDLVSLVCI